MLHIIQRLGVLTERWTRLSCIRTIMLLASNFAAAVSSASFWSCMLWCSIGERVSAPSLHTRLYEYQRLRHAPVGTRKHSMHDVQLTAVVGRQNGRVLSNAECSNRWTAETMNEGVLCGGADQVCGTHDPCLFWGGVGYRHGTGTHDTMHLSDH